ncbi:wax ester/triacylglycerol synthase family O-acyltransferase [Mycobacterium sp. TY815]|uniref:wax ester/triacylglycerol synthase family O-acyltransferase n=1 Tax=Mycobacterium sp. TY815 TaxID=3050581 RepID=UPI0027403AC0|nr:wax ester/triacylglycerol synthase family O-acyltransferase [Mycobacterium sp. TY815]MDP7702129.1 wax ester/triacylglycerol synthase family O-acyltransferase [Mycobacterium sp. TY815]
MDRLSTVEASFLEAEDADRHLSMAIGALAVIDGPAPGHDELIAALSDRLGRVTRLTQVVHQHPLQVAAPELMVDNNFDITHHVRWAVMPQPADEAALFRTVTDLMERRLDRNHPLWECWIIEGLPERRWVALLKIHHCLADEVAAVRMLTCISDSGTGVLGELRVVEPMPPSKVSGRTVNPLGWARQIWRASLIGADMASQTAREAGEFVTGLLSPMGALQRQGPVAGTRGYSAVRVPLKDVDTVCEVFGVTRNDVTLAAITDSFRAVLLRHGRQPRRNSLRTLIPVSLGSPEPMDRIDIRASAMLPYLPVEQKDPVKRLRLIHARQNRTDESGAARTSDGLADHLPFMLSAWGIRLLMRLPQRSIVTLAAYVPGPRQRLQVLGRPVEMLLPIPPTAAPMSTVVSTLSYVDDLVLGVTADNDATPDADEIAGGIELGVARLLARALARRRSGPKRVRPQGRQGSRSPGPRP